MWGKKFLITVLFAISVASGLAPTNADEIKPTVTVVMQVARWSGSKDLSPSYLSGIYNQLKDQAAPFWMQLLDNSISIETVDLTAEPVTLLGKLSCSTPRDTEESRIASADKATHKGTVVRLVLVDFSHCGLASSSYTGDIKTSTWHFLSAERNVYVVELEQILGHALGLFNSSTAACIQAGISDTGFSSCKYESYSVSHDLMGDVWGGIWEQVFSGSRGRSDLLNIHNRWRLGIIKPGEIREVWERDIRLDLMPSTASQGVRGLYIKVDGVEYLVEYRVTYYGASGVSVLRLGSPSSPMSRIRATTLKPTDALPSTAGDGALMKRGDIFANAGKSMTVEVLSMDKSSAQVRVTRSDRPSREAVTDPQATAAALMSGTRLLNVTEALVPITELKFRTPSGEVRFIRERTRYSVPLTAMPDRPEWSDSGAYAEFGVLSGELKWLSDANGLTTLYGDGSSQDSSFVSIAAAAKPAATPMPEPTVEASPKATARKAIVCVKGKQQKRVVAANPRCPAGWKRK